MTALYWYEVWTPAFWTMFIGCSRFPFSSSFVWWDLISINGWNRWILIAKEKKIILSWNSFYKCFESHCIAPTHKYKNGRNFWLPSLNEMPICTFYNLFTSTRSSDTEQKKKANVIGRTHLNVWININNNSSTDSMTTIFNLLVDRRSLANENDNKMKPRQQTCTTPWSLPSAWPNNMLPLRKAQT